MLLMILLKLRYQRAYFYNSILGELYKKGARTYAILGDVNSPYTNCGQFATEMDEDYPDVHNNFKLFECNFENKIFVMTYSRKSRHYLVYDFFV